MSLKTYDYANNSFFVKETRTNAICPLSFMTIYMFIIQYNYCYSHTYCKSRQSICVNVVILLKNLFS